MMEDIQGHDAVFINGVSDHLICVVCHMVLKDPVQIMSCGHRFCKRCFGKIQTHSRQMNMELICPIDRKSINMQTVFDDIGVARMIGDLQVKCSCHTDGCSWVGELSNLQDHQVKCPYHLQKDAPSVVLELLLQRMNSCEERMTEMKLSLQEKEVEIKLIKEMNADLEREIKIMKDLSQLRKDQLDKEVDTLKMKYLSMEKKIEKMDISSSDDTINVQDELKKLQDNICSTQSSLDDAILNKKVDMKKQADTMDDIRNEMKKEIGRALAKIEKLEKKNVSTRKTERCSGTNGCERLKELTSHVENLENILFCFHAPKHEDVQLQWVLQDYEFNRQIGKDVYSPMFYPEIDGYSFQLLVGWTGKNKEKLGLYLHLYCRKHKVNLKPIKMTYTFEILNKGGESKISVMDESDIDKFRSKCFTIHPGKNEADESCGFKILEMPSLMDYVHNDKLYISCTLQPY